MTSRRTQISPKSGRGLGQMTPTIFGSTVGYPSDSLASCFLYVALYIVRWIISSFRLYTRITVSAEATLSVDFGLMPESRYSKETHKERRSHRKSD